MSPRVKAAALSVSATGLFLIAGFESSHSPRLDAYDDGTGVQTICDGHTKGVTRGMHVTPGQCQVWLHEDASDAGHAVGRCVTEPITQQQYDALVSLAFNIGGGAFCGSTLVRRLNAGDCHGAAGQFDRWVHANGRILRGLVKRRSAERANFEQHCAGAAPESGRIAEKAAA